MRFVTLALIAGGALAAAARGASGQAAPSPDPAPLAVGAVAPDFSVPAATRYGVLARPIHLSDFRGKTVVVAFFFKARTKG
ncbi:MAG TPA: hypothetical protein VEU74_05130 [Gemmatimonadales bacterium]|nr:hypothetical protein [Gemmatimonadales bacterium]